MNIQDFNKNIQFVFRLVSECLAVVFCCAAAQAQKQTDVKDYVDFGLEIANNHLWRGIEVSDGLVMCASVMCCDCRSDMPILPHSRKATA